jgi:4-hydroxybenzoate polyprenyltransferase
MSDLNKIYLLIISLRPKQWIKNLIVFAGILFAQKIFDPAMFLKTIEAFVIFCAASSSVYLINDLRDQEQDRLHPKKKHRPIASGAVAPSLAWVTLVILLPAILILSFWLNYVFGLIVLLYLIMMFGYTYRLKEIAVLDAFIISGGFVLRGVAGVEIVGIYISPWFLICASLLALFIVFCKRRHEVLVLKDNAEAHRKILSEYNAPFLDQLIGIISSATIVTYILYTLAPETVAKFHTRGLLLTAPFVVFGLFRFLWFVYRKNDGGSAEDIIIKDPIMVMTMVGWLAAAILVLYGKAIKIF